MTWSFETWDWDLPTILWAVWIAFFFVVETVTLLNGSNEELTEHLRPVFLAAPITWFLTLGLWLWMGFHFLAPAFEAGLIDRLGR